MGPDGGFFEVGEGHRLWVRTWGAAGGVPVLMLHGGPGSGCNPGMEGLFDASRHRVIFLDQRGAGKSLPARSREANTTAHLLADIEALRQALGLDRWYLVGGSWGATLALAYAEAHPARVQGLALRSVFMGTRAELDWAFDQGLWQFFPEHHARLHGLVAGAADPMAALWQAILDPDPAVHRPAALAFYRAERVMSELAPGPDLPDLPPNAPLPATPFMEAHYFANRCFLGEDALIRNAGRLAGIPGEIVQALQDLLCPPATSARLAGVWPAARRVVVGGAGHGLHHPPVFAALRTAIARLTG